MIKKHFLIFLFFVFLVITFNTNINATDIKMGILPVLDTLPLQVALKEGFFKEEGINMELIPFNSAIERDTAIQTGNIDGYFGDLLNTLMLIDKGIPIRIITISYSTTRGERMFALVGSPVFHPNSLIEVKNATIGISNATIIEYLLDQMLQKHGIPRDAFKRIEVKKIPLRLQMLLANQLNMALLPEPLVSLAEQQGSRIFFTDEDLNMPLTVLCLHKKIVASSGLSDAFLKAYKRAIKALRNNKDRYRSLMARTCRIPPSLVKTFKIPTYPEPRLPLPSEIKKIEVWMKEHKLLQNSIPYEHIVVN